MRLKMDLAPYDRDDDLDGPWTREQLIAMDMRFVTALEQAFELGRVLINSVHVCFAPKATEIPRFREMTRCAMSRTSWRFGPDGWTALAVSAAGPIRDRRAGRFRGS